MMVEILDNVTTYSPMKPHQFAFCNRHKYSWWVQNQWVLDIDLGMSTELRKRSPQPIERGNQSNGVFGEKLLA
jgi:hypothetical protein